MIFKWVLFNDFQLMLLQDLRFSSCMILQNLRAFSNFISRCSPNSKSLENTDTEVDGWVKAVLRDCLAQSHKTD